jgi:molybdate transport system substrate-binding protein
MGDESTVGLMTVPARRRTAGFVGLVVAFVLACFPAAQGETQELRVMTSGAFRAAYLQLVPEFERLTPNKIVTINGASMGNDPTTIPSRLGRGEAADVVILADEALLELIKQGRVVRESRVQLVRSGIGMAVRTGAPKPDISSVEALKQTLLRAKSIAYSSSASGVYLSKELFPRLGVADQIRGKSKEIDVEPVGAVVARGEAEVGFQQTSELLPVPGVEYVGPLPPGAQQITIFAAGIVVGAKRPDAAKALIKFLLSPASASIVRKTGLEPVTTP